MMPLVMLTSLTQIVDERGKIMHMLKRTDPEFIEFGEIYFSCAWPKVVKAWHLHKSMTLNLAVISGRGLFHCYDTRPGSPKENKLETYILGQESYGLLTIPPMVWSGYTSLDGETVIVANCATEPHSRTEIIYAPFNKLPKTDVQFEWAVSGG